MNEKEVFEQYLTERLLGGNPIIRMTLDEVGDFMNIKDVPEFMNLPEEIKISLLQCIQLDEYYGTNLSSSLYKGE